MTNSSNSAALPIQQFASSIITHGGRTLAFLLAISGRSVRLVALAAIATLLAPRASGSDQLFQEARPAMGTTFTIYLYARNQATANARPGSIG
jgi:hypothetical protein